MSKRNGKPCKRCGSNDWNGSGKCKHCKSEQGKAYRANNEEKVKARKKAYQENNREKVRASFLRWLENNRDKKREADKAWALTHPENLKRNHRRWRSKPENKLKVSVISKAWRENNKDKAKEQSKKWCAEHHEACIARVHRRRALKRNAPGKYTTDEWNQLLEKCGHKCLGCGRDDVPLSVDHIIPLSRGGSNSIDNIQPLCQLCNNKKFTKTTDYRYAVMEQ